MKIKVRIKDSVIILDISGRIDVNSAHLVEVVGQCLRDGYSDLICNFEDVDFIDYMGVSAIVLAFKEVSNHSGRMKFVGLQPHIKNLLSVTGIDRVIEAYPSEESAVKSFKEDKVIEDIKRMQLRRRFKRLPLDIKVELVSKSHRSPVCLKVDVLNLSGVGAYIFGCDKFKLGDEVLLRMKLPPNHEQIDIEAKVVWLSDKQIQRHIHPGMGVAFHPISSQLQNRLIEFIERNLPMASSEEQG